MKDEQKYLSPEQVTEAYYKTLIAENHTLKQHNEEMKAMLGEIRDSELFIAGEHFSPVAKQITDLLTKHKL